MSRRSVLKSGVALLALTLLGSLVLAPMAFGGVTRYDQTDPAIAYTPTWNFDVPAAGFYGGTYAWTNANGTATFTFTGEGIDWIGRHQVLFGIAQVSVDGGAWEDVNLYSTTDTLSLVVWSKMGLDPGSHTVTIRWTGIQDPASAQGVYSGGVPPYNPAALVGIDAFDVYSDLTPPVITVNGAADDEAYTDPVTITFSANDAVDGPVAATATLNGDPFTSGDAVSDPGGYTLVVSSTDSSGNTGTTTISFTIEEPPAAVSTSASGPWGLALLAVAGLAGVGLVVASKERVST